MSKFVKLLMAGLAITLTNPIATQAQSNSVSPTLLIETMPSDRPDYRRMIYIHYLNGSYVNVSYVAYNRTEFRQIPNRPSRDAIRACASGPSSRLSDIDGFERSEAQLKRSGQSPESKSFCIKNVRNWQDKNQKRYLDPIFNGLPFAASLKNSG